MNLYNESKTDAWYVTLSISGIIDCRYSGHWSLSWFGKGPAFFWSPWCADSLFSRWHGRILMSSTLGLIIIFAIVLSLVILEGHCALSEK